MKIFVCIESYLPGTLGGGPLRALLNLIEHLHAEHEFFIFTRNHDYLDPTEYTEVQPNAWLSQSKTSVYYTSDQHIESQMRAQIEAVQPDWIYLNGALPGLTRTCLKLRRKVPSIQAIPVLLAPHGNLSASALAHHRLRKQAWLAYAKARSLYHDVVWHAASTRETEQIRAVLGAAAQIREVPMAPVMVGTCVPESAAITRPGAERTGTSGNLESETVECPTANQQAAAFKSQVSPLKPPCSSLRLVYFGRLSPEKNLPFAFERLSTFAARHPEQSVVYDVIGSGEPRYAARLRKLSAHLPNSIQVNFLGQLPPSSLSAQLSARKYHALLMPSLTENFSYTVLESWQAGIPVLISDQTPWRDLEQKGLGWDLPLRQLDRWLQAVDQLSVQSRSADEARAQYRSQQVKKFASTWVSDYRQRVDQLFA